MYSGSVIVILLGITVATDNPDSSPCRRYELVPCGDSRGKYQWEFCTISVPNQRITEVHLDIRYVNRYCKKSNFGVTTNHEKIWVHQWCFGTFLVCFVPEEGFKENSGTISDIDNNSMDKKRWKQSEELHKKSTKGQKKPSTADHTQYTENTTIVEATNDFTDLENDNTVKALESAKTTTKLFHSNNDLSSAAVNHSLTANKQQLSSGQSLSRITARVWIIAAVCVAGGTILIITGVIAVMILNGCGGSADNGDRRLSQENISTAHLVEEDSETTPTKSVYDFIPIDPETGFPSLSCEDISPNSEQLEKDFHEKDKQNTKLNIYDRAVSANEYDVLNRRQKPCRSVSETSNYSHLGDIDYAVTSENDTQNSDVAKHEYAILIPCDAGHFQFIEEEINCQNSC